MSYVCEAYNAEHRIEIPGRGPFSTEKRLKMPVLGGVEPRPYEKCHVAERHNAARLRLFYNRFVGVIG